MRQRPTVITVFGVLNIVFGSLGVTCLGVGLVTQAAMAPALQRFGGMQQWSATPASHAWGIVGGSVGMLAAVVLIVAGVGLLLMRPWGRAVSIGYAAWKVFWAFVNLAAMWLIMVPAMKQQPAQMPPGVLEGMMVVSSVVGLVIALAYPVLLLVFMTRPYVVAALRAPEEPTASLP